VRGANGLWDEGMVVMSRYGGRIGSDVSGHHVRSFSSFRVSQKYGSDFKIYGSRAMHEAKLMRAIPHHDCLPAIGGASSSLYSNVASDSAASTKIENIAETDAAETNTQRVRELKSNVKFLSLEREFKSLFGKNNYTDLLHRFKEVESTLDEFDPIILSLVLSSFQNSSHDLTNPRENEDIIKKHHKRFQSQIENMPYFQTALTYTYLRCRNFFAASRVYNVIPNPSFALSIKMLSEASKQLQWLSPRAISSNEQQFKQRDDVLNVCSQVWKKLQSHPREQIIKLSRKFLFWFPEFAALDGGRDMYQLYLDSVQANISLNTETILKVLHSFIDIGHLEGAAHVALNTYKTNKDALLDSTLRSVLLLAAQILDLNAGLKMFEILHTKGVSNSSDYHSLLHLLSKRHRVEDVLKTLNVALSSGVEIQREIFDHVASNLELDREKCVSLYFLVKEKGSKNPFHWNLVFQSCTKILDLELGYSIYQEMVEMGVEPTVQTYDSLMELCLRLKMNHHVDNLAQEMERRKIPYSSKTYGYLIDSLSFRKRIPDAEAMLDRALKDSSVTPDQSWFVGLMFQSRGEDKSDTRKRLIERMEEAKLSTKGIQWVLRSPNENNSFDDFDMQQSPVPQ